MQEPGAGEQVFAGAGGGITAHQAMNDVRLNQRFAPYGRILKQGKYAITVRVAPGLDGPPQEKRDVNVVDVFAVAKQAADDGQGVGGGQTTSGASELTANGGYGLQMSQRFEFVSNRRRDIFGIAEQAYGPESHGIIVM